MEPNPAYPTVDEFEQRLLAESTEKLVDELIFPGLPFIFRENPELFDQLRQRLVTNLGVDSANITIIGSGKLGFSLAPDSFRRSFSPQSDIDVLVVDERLFDLVWFSLLNWHYVRSDRDINGYERRWIGARNSIYWGWVNFEDFIIKPGEEFRGKHLLRPLVDLRVRWFNVFNELSRLRELSRRKVSGRLYRTWGHARMYHVNSLSQVIARLRGRN